MIAVGFRAARRNRTFRPYSRIWTGPVTVPSVTKMGLQTAVPVRAGYRTRLHRYG